MVRAMAELGRVLPLGGVDVNVRSSMSAAESCRSAFGHLQPFWIAPISAKPGSAAAAPKRTPTEQLSMSRTRRDQPLDRRSNRLRRTI
jgi:hypothetical protein